MTTAESATLFLAAIALYVVAADLLRRLRMRGLRERLRMERNRNRFGELRTKIVRQAVEGELDPKAQIFSSIYQGATTLMRNPYAMELAARAILLIPPPDGVSPGPRPTRAEGEAALDFAKRIDLLCRDYSDVYVVAARLHDSFARRHRPPLWLGMVAARAERQQRIKTMIEARERLEGTAQAARC